MEKKTAGMGSFISALRRASGMTQRELGERLFVSDKTVSRWERDECTPDLSLIPLIADLFGITADELLRGERSTAQSTAENGTCVPETSISQKRKNDRHFETLVNKRKTKYRNLSVISLGLALLGVIVAAIINLGFLRAYVGFGVACAFLLAAVISQICFANSCRLFFNEEQQDDTIFATHRDAILAYNSYCMLTAKNIFLTILLLFAFCLPLAVLVNDAYWGLSFTSWLLWGLAFAAVALIAAHSLWQLCIRKALTKRDMLTTTLRKQQGYRLERRLLDRSLVLFASVGLLILIATTVIQSIDVTAFAQSYIFETQEDFVAFMEQEDPSQVIHSYKGLFSTIEIEVPVEQSPTYHVDISQNVEKETTDTQGETIRKDFYDREGNVLFTYICRRNISRMKLSDTEDGFPVRVYTNEQIRMGFAVKDAICTATIVVYTLFGAVLIVIYIKKLLTLRKTYQ